MSTLNPSAIPGLDIFEHEPRPRSLPVPEVREFERIDPKTLNSFLNGTNFSVGSPRIRTKRNWISGARHRD